MTRPDSTDFVRFMWQRASIMSELAALADGEYQERVWQRGEMPHEDYFDSLDSCIDHLYDMFDVFPDPGSLVGYSLIDGTELDRLRDLRVVLEEMIERLQDEPDEAYFADARWPVVQGAAARALTAMLLEGPLPGGDVHTSIDDSMGAQSVAVEVLLERGFLVWRDPGTGHWTAIKDGERFSGEHPLAVLGLLFLREHRGRDWATKPEEPNLAWTSDEEEDE